MEAGRDLKRSGSKMPHVPSFNDFCSGVESDVLDMPQLKLPKQPPPMVERSWSVDSSEGTPRLSARSSFSETFTRALYEHMRGN
jgi:hypothetical protein